MDDDEKFYETPPEDEVLPPRIRMKRMLMWMLGDEKKVMWFTILLTGLVVFGTTQMFRLHERVAISLVAMILVWLMWVFILAPPEEEEVQQGWAITWIDKRGELPFIPRENNLQIVFCNYKKYPDGGIETIPLTEHYGVYLPDGISRFKFNPMVNPEIVKHLEKEYGEPVVWADGTDSYFTPLAVEHRRINKVIQSGTKMALKKTTEWAHR